MTADAAPTAGAPSAPRKLSLPEQADLLDYLAQQGRSQKSDPAWACQPMWVTHEDIEDLQRIAQTLRLFAQHGADAFVRQKIRESRR